MAESLIDQIVYKVEQAPDLYHRLILIVAPSGSGKTSALQAAKVRTEAPVININLQLSKMLLDLTGRQRSLQVPVLLSEIVNQTGSDVIQLDNIEILFDVSLKQDPLRLLQGLSRNRTLVVAWNGAISDGYITYATPEHPEYRKYSARDLLVISPASA